MDKYYELKSKIPELVDLSSYALKSEYDAKILALENTIASLLVRIEVLEPKVPELPKLPEFYQG